MYLAENLEKLGNSALQREDEVEIGESNSGWRGGVRKKNKLFEILADCMTLVKEHYL